MARKAPAKTTAPDQGPVVTVKGPKKGRRRCGRDFGPEPVSIPLAKLSEKEQALLSNDPALTCVWPEDTDK